MKLTLMPAACASALALMAGAAAAHFFSVRQLVTIVSLQADDRSPALHSEPATRPPGAPRDTLAMIDEIRRQNASLQQTLVSTGGDSARRGTPAPPPDDDMLAGILRELTEQNRYLRDQVAETNRNLMQLEFRVDTHSEQFRPLKLNGDAGELEDFSPLGDSSIDSIGSTTGYDDTSIGVLPPLDLP